MTVRCSNSVSSESPHHFRSDANVRPRCRNSSAWRSSSAISRGLDSMRCSLRISDGRARPERAQAEDAHEVRLGEEVLLDKRLDLSLPRSLKFPSREVVAHE